ncbi:pimeloyl-ACP methyl ester carboxylesterase [Arthrobacter pascens]|uniref:alpha/beta fold hydrolase n=1 Tax=Arthrobacter pascens TaxID=1677 RepID=UPI002786E939|nr:alpha/beta hydrolase [Arthrobacter pascens]MDQ0635841.1 pimeloyl-ACP methyl ester carboxylesterase [Arthrobacter pascens]
METWTLETDDGGRLAVHSFLTAAATASPVSSTLSSALASKAAGISTDSTPADSTSADRERTTSGPPGVVVIHGTLVTDALYRPFARKLSVLLGRPVHCYNRRGRAGSTPQPDAYSVETEISDLATVMRETGSTDVVAHSYGGFVALQAARTVAMGRLVTYDAAVSLSGSLKQRWRPELEDAVTAGQLNRAWAHLVQGLTTAGPVSYLPLGALRMLSILSARTNVGAEMRQLLPTAVAEMRAVLDADAELDDFTRLTTPILMLSGGWSPAYFAETGRQLAAAVPSIEFAIVPGQLHEGPIRPGKGLAVRIARFINGTGSPAPRLGRRR